MATGILGAWFLHLRAAKTRKRNGAAILLVGPGILDYPGGALHRKRHGAALVVVPTYELKLQCQRQVHCPLGMQPVGQPDSHISTISGGCHAHSSQCRKRSVHPPLLPRPLMPPLPQSPQRLPLRLQPQQPHVLVPGRPVAIATSHGLQPIRSTAASFSATQAARVLGQVT